ncbi:hypothetical protein Tco_1455921 [Tanacetum coccineum]
MHTRASNSELVEPLLEPERTLNRRRRRRNRRVPFDQRNNPPKNPRIVYPPILDINHFRHFLVTLENLYPMDDEPMWAADRVVAPTPGSAITIPETANEFAIKGYRSSRALLLCLYDGFHTILTGDVKTMLDESMKELLKLGMNFEPLSLADSFSLALFYGLRRSNRAFFNMKNESLTRCLASYEGNASKLPYGP